MIPLKAHFIWLGPDFRWVHALAIRSAFLNGGFESLVLYHDCDLSSKPWFQELQELPSVTTRHISPRQVLAQGGFLENELVALYDRLSQPAAISNILRALILWREGGVYLDLDTVTLQPFRTLHQQAGFFCGLERITKPAKVIYSNRLWFKLKVSVLWHLRNLLRQVPSGWRIFRGFEALYFSAANNAIFGCQQGHPLVESMLRWMVEQPAERQTRRYSLGVHTLQECLDNYDEDDLLLLPPRVFSPLAPEISQHWFRLNNRDRLEEVLSPDTYAVHWYASVRTRELLPLIDPEYVASHAHHQLFSKLASNFL